MNGDEFIGRREKVKVVISTVLQIQGNDSLTEEIWLEKDIIYE